jgi:UrcA family protein
MSFLSRPLAAALLSAAVAIPCFASAQSTVREVVVRPDAAGAEVRAEKVSFSDLNLDHAAGVRTLLSRLRGAAKRVCAADDGTARLLNDGARVCMHASLERAVTEVNSPLVSAMFQKQG